MYQLELSKSVKKFLLLHKDIARLFFEKVAFLLDNPFDTTIDIKPLQGEE
jgi:mRNA-degrading endonuclease RelE of RelBE toxin-antitoxin system